MRLLFLVLLLTFLEPSFVGAQEVPPAEGSAESPPELIPPAIPEGYLLSVRVASNADRRGPGPAEFQHRPSDEAPPLRVSDPAERILLELGGGIVAVSASLALGYAIGLEEGDDMRTASTLLFAYLLGPTYTWLGGSIIGGGAGTWGGAFIGESIGACVGGLFAWWAHEERQEEGMWVSLLLVPSLGAILGLEVQHELRVSQDQRDRAETENDAVVIISASIAPTPGGGLMTIRVSF